MITEEDKSGEINYINIYTTKTYKYVRYIGPNGKNSTISVLNFMDMKYKILIMKVKKKKNIFLLSYHLL